MLLRFSRAPLLFTFNIFRGFATRPSSRRIPKHTKAVIATETQEDAVQSIFESKKNGGFVVPESETAFNFESDFADAGQVVSAEFLRETEAAVDELFRDLLSQPPDAEQRAKDARTDWAALPHDPDEFFLHRSKTIGNYVLLLRVHIAKGLTYEGFRVYETAVREGDLTPSIEFYSLLISLCGAYVKSAPKTIAASPSRFKNEATKAIELFDELRSRGFVPDVYTYGSLIGSLSKLGHIEQAFRVLEMMKFQRIFPETKIYTSLIVGCYNTLQFDKAFEMFMEMRINGLQADVITYNMMMRIEAKKESPEGALGYMTQMEHFELTPDIQSFTLCIYSCAKRPDYHEKAFELYDIAMARGYRPTALMLNSLIFVASNMGDIETARLLFDQFKLYKLERTDVTYSTMLRVIAKKIRQDFYICHDGSKLDRMKRVEMAQTYFDEFLATGETPSRKLLNSMLSVYTRGFRMAQAEEFRKIVFPKNGQECDYYSYLSLISMYYRIKALDKCYDTFIEMKSVGLKPDYDIYMLVLRTCKYRKSDFLGVKVLKEMNENGIVADEDIAFPFQEIVENLPGYKALAPIGSERGIAVNEGVGTVDDRMIAQAKRQRELMLQAPEALSLLERTRKSRFNDYNPAAFHPNNPEFVRNYVNRKRDKFSKLEKPAKYVRAKNYQEGLLSDPDPQAKLVGEKILNFNMKEIQGQYILEGGEQADKPLLIPKEVRIKPTQNPPRSEL